MEEPHVNRAASPSVGALAVRLAGLPTLPIRQVEFEFEWSTVSAEPGETIWQFWWAKVIGTTPVLALSYLHHVATTHRSIDNPGDVLTSMLLAPLDGVSDPTITVHDMLAPLLAYRLVFAEHDSDGALGLGLVSPIPRPSRAAADAIGTQLTAAAAGGGRRS